MTREATLVPLERIESKILMIRGEKVMLDSDLAKLYGVETGQMNRAVRRNLARFPSDFMFQLTPKEAANLRCQIGISSSAAHGGRRYLPRAFTEQGVAMLASVLNSERAALVNIAIVRAFVRLRRILASHEGLARKLAELERKYDAQFRVVFDAIKALMDPPEPERKGRIGFRPEETDPATRGKRPVRSARAGAIATRLSRRAPRARG